MVWKKVMSKLVKNPASSVAAKAMPGKKKMETARKRANILIVFIISFYGIIMHSMYITVLKSKIHLATLTDAEVGYEGSIAVDKSLMRAAGLVEGEKVAVLNENNANRFETYVIEGKKGQVGLRGPAAKLGKKGDRVIIISYALMDQKEASSFKAKKIFVDAKNNLKS